MNIFYLWVHCKTLTKKFADFIKTVCGFLKFNKNLLFVPLWLGKTPLNWKLTRNDVYSPFRMTYWKFLFRVWIKYCTWFYWRNSLPPYSDWAVNIQLKYLLLNLKHETFLYISIYIRYTLFVCFAQLTIWLIVNNIFSWLRAIQWTDVLFLTLKLTANLNFTFLTIGTNR